MRRGLRRGREVSSPTGCPRWRRRAATMCGASRCRSSPNGQSHNGRRLRRSIRSVERLRRRGRPMTNSTFPPSCAGRQPKADSRLRVNREGRSADRPSCGAPGMGIDLEVEVLSRAGHSERSEPQRVGPGGRREGSGERSCGPTNRNRIRGGAEQGERAIDREALVTKARRRRSGGRAAKADALTRGGLALRLKGRRGSQDARSEKSAEAIVAVQAAKGRTMGKARRPRASGKLCHRSRTKVRA